MSIKSFFKNDSGAAAAEYALILSLVAVAIITAAIELGSSINGTTYGVARTLETGTSGSGSSSGGVGHGMHAGG